MLTPGLVATTEIVARTCIQINLPKGAPAPTVTVTTDSPQQIDEALELTANGHPAASGTNSPSSRLRRSLTGTYRRDCEKPTTFLVTNGFEVWFGTGATQGTVSVGVKELSKTHVVQLSTDGSIWVNFSGMPGDAAAVLCRKL